MIELTNQQIDSICDNWNSDNVIVVNMEYNMYIIIQSPESPIPLTKEQANYIANKLSLIYVKDLFTKEGGRFMNKHRLEFEINKHREHAERDMLIVSHLEKHLPTN